MTEQTIFGDAATHTTLEGINIVDALANVGAFTKQILIHIGDSPCIQVQPSIASIHLSETRAIDASRLYFSAGLQQGVAGDHAFRAKAIGRKHGTIEWMGKCGNHYSRATTRQHCVGIQRDDIANRR